MTIHYCMQSPCPVCLSGTTRLPWQVSSPQPRVIPSQSTFTISTWGLPMTQRFYTWREAMLTALRSKSTMRPTVRRDALDGMWVVTTYQQPVLYNQEAS